jgi:hypothetical protein
MKRFAHGSPGGSRGNALVLAVFIVLALTSVGVVSIQRTNMDLMVAGNITRKTQAVAAGEAGMSFGLAQVGSNPHLYLDTIEVQKTGGNLSTGGDISATDVLTATVAERSTALADLEMANRISHVAYDAPARMRQDIAFRVRAGFVNEFKAGPGNSTDVDICYELFDFRTEGGLPTRFGETVDETLNQKDTVVISSLARAVVGEVKCRLQQ